MKIFVQILFLLLSITIRVTLSENKIINQILLDTDNDYMNRWIKVSCNYGEYYEDFSHFGCPVDPNEPKDTVGFWTSCKTPCRIVYHGGENLPPPLEIILSAYIEGDATIEILGKSSLDDPAEEQVGNISNPGWDEHSFDLSALNANVLYFNLIKRSGNVLIDNIIVTVDEEEEETTTPLPPPFPDSIILDKTEDRNQIEWINVVCFYGNQYSDFFGAGCPVSENGLSPNNGFWKPCYDSTCEFVYYGGVLQRPNFISVRAYVTGTSSVKIMGKRSPNDEFADEVGEILPIREWQEVTFDLSQFDQSFVYKIEALKGTSGEMIIDRIIVSRDPDFIVDPPDITEFTTIETTTGPTEEPTTTTTTTSPITITTPIESTVTSEVTSTVITSSVPTRETTVITPIPTIPPNPTTTGQTTGETEDPNTTETGDSSSTHLKSSLVFTFFLSLMSFMVLVFKF